MAYQASPGRYAYMEYRRCGNSGLKLPALSLGLWHNFGRQDDYEKCRSIIHTAFDSGITHIDLANNYGPPPGGAEETFGKILKEDFKTYRDELIISTKAGYPMWPGPYGDFGSKKYLVASLYQSLKRMGLDYVDIFYHHRPDPETPIEETMMALHQMVQQGKALYIGLSSYSPEQTKEAYKVLNSLGTPLLIHQPKYSMLVRNIENGLLDTLEKTGVGCITFSSLAQGILTDRYLKGIPEDSRAASGRGNGALDSSVITDELISKVQQLNALAEKREQTLAQMSLAWVLKDKRITSVIVGASKPQQILDSVQSLRNYNFSDDELRQIDQILG
ncbi:MAG: L-glyceraldehyde 3-phosphate reductase [Chitinophagaceae bacterium]|nr:MAG: L-glyceraldehyde 3-phosphate reductase [Chitinophagaceae bacterium]